MWKDLDCGRALVDCKAGFALCSSSVGKDGRLFLDVDADDRRAALRLLIFALVDDRKVGLDNRLFLLLLNEDDPMLKPCFLLLLGVGGAKEKSSHERISDVR